jgi:hypothetical protein
MFRELLSQEFAPFGSLSAQQLDALEAHYNLLMRWNARLNLTRILKLEEIVRFHYCESLFLGTRLPAGPYTVADIGSGPATSARRFSWLRHVEVSRRSMFRQKGPRTPGNVTNG